MLPATAICLLWASRATRGACHSAVSRDTATSPSMLHQVFNQIYVLHLRETHGLPTVHLQMSERDLCLLLSFWLISISRILNPKSTVTCRTTFCSALISQSKRRKPPTRKWLAQHQTGEGGAGIITHILLLPVSRLSLTLCYVSMRPCLTCVLTFVYMHPAMTGPLWPSLLSLIPI